MTCPLLNDANRARQNALLLDHAAGRLEPSERAMLDRHMENCPACTSYRMEQTAVWNALDLWEPAPVTMDFNRRLWQRIDAGAAAPWYGSLAASLRFANWKPVVPLAAAILVMAAGFVFDHPNGKPLVSGMTISGMTIKEADQVEQTLDDIDLLHQLDTVAVSPAANSKTM